MIDRLNRPLPSFARERFTAQTDARPIARLRARGAPVKVVARRLSLITRIMVTRTPQGPEQARRPVPARIR